MKWFLKVLKQYADFKGRASREEYWMFFLFNILATLILAVIGYGLAMLQDKSGAILLPFLYLTAVLTPSIAVSVRRLHDTGRSAWFYLVSLIPLVGGIWLLVVFMTKGVPENNCYGTNPLLTHNTRYYRKRSASIALILASVFWLYTYIPSLFSQAEWNIIRLLSFILPVGLLIAGSVLFLKRMFSSLFAWSLIVLSVFWLLCDVLTIRDTYVFLFESFNIMLFISLLTVLIPLALLLSGIYVLCKITDKTVPVCLLFAGSFIWIISIVLNIIKYKGEFSNPTDVFSLVNNAIVITVPVSLLVLARTLLIKEKSVRETADILSEPAVIQTAVRKDLEPAVDRTHRNVEFLREDKDENNIWMVYKSTSKTEAMKFLSQQTINRPSYFIVVETPDGNFGRDKDGFYQE